uniref:Uncharacterized protein n=1 Tax=uncultured bacterium 246 TaxID=698384 RepID=E3T6E2_9BACT|nr:hypothetical protein [uncultured bacterium 246]
MTYRTDDDVEHLREHIGKLEATNATLEKKIEQLQIDRDTERDGLLGEIGVLEERIDELEVSITLDEEQLDALHAEYETERDGLHLEIALLEEKIDELESFSMDEVDELRAEIDALNEQLEEAAVMVGSDEERVISQANCDIIFIGRTVNGGSTYLDIT